MTNREKKEKDVIERYLDNFTSKNTKSTYYYQIKYYFDFIKKDSYEYVTKNQDYTADIKHFAQHLQLRPPTTQRNYLNSIKKFLEEYDIELKKKIWKNIHNRIKGNRPVTIDKIPNNSELKVLLSHANTRVRALFLLMSSTGIRKGETLQLTWDDIDIENRTVHVPAKVAKNGIYRYTFFTEECREALIEYKKEYPARVKYAEERTMGICPNFKANNRVFTMDDAGVSYEWYRLLHKSGKPFTDRDKTTNRYKYHVHTLRKFFKKQLALTEEMYEPKVEFLMGHDGYCHGAYDDYRNSIEILKHDYDEHCKSLTVFSDLNKLDDMIKPFVQKQDTTISQLAQENQELKQNDNKIKDMLHKKDLDYQQQLSDIRKQMEQQMAHVDEMIKSKWYKLNAEPNIQIISTNCGQQIPYTIEPNNYSVDELLKKYQDNQQEMASVKKLGLKEWSRRKLELTT